MTDHAGSDAAFAPAARRVGLSVPLSGLVAAIACVALIMLPKMGFAVGGVPFNLSVAVGEALALWGWALALGRLRGPRERTGLVFILLAFAIWYVNFFYYITAYTVPPRDMARMIFILLPMTGFGIAYLMILRPTIGDAVVRSLPWGFGFLAVYALLQLVLGAETVALRNVTAIYEDTFDEVVSRHNVIYGLVQQGTQFAALPYKLFGTYANGNLFSANLVLMAPIAIHLMRSLAAKVTMLMAFNLVIVFSASASAYAGALVVNALFYLALARREAVLAALLPVGAFGLGYGAFLATCADLQCTAARLVQIRLLQRDLTEDVRFAKISEWLDSIGEKPLNFLFGEMYGLQSYVFEVMPLAIMQYFGVVVFLLFYIILFDFLRPLRLRFYKAGVLGYLAMSFGEGAFWTTPTPYVLGIALGAAVVLDRREDAVRFAREVA